MTSEPTLAAYLQAARHRPWIIVLCAVVLGTAAFLVLGRGVVVYERQADVIVRASTAQSTFDPGSDSTRLLDRSFLANEVRFASSDSIRNEVIARLGETGETTPASLNVRVEPDPDADVLQFVSRATDTDRATRMANTYAQVYVEARRQNAVASFSGAISLLEDQLELLRANRDELRSDADALAVRLANAEPDSAQERSLQAQLDAEERSISSSLAALSSEEAAAVDSLSRLRVGSQLAATGTAEIVGEAFDDGVALPGRGPQAAVVGGVVGAVIGALLALALERADSRIRSVGELEETIAGRAQLLGAVPKLRRTRARRISVFTEPNSGYAEAIYQIRSALLFLLRSSRDRLIVVTSANEGEGKTTLAVNLAWSLPEVAGKTALIDLDLRQDNTIHHFGIASGEGASDILERGAHPADVTFEFQDHKDQLRYIPAGRAVPNPSDVLARSAVEELLATISDDRITLVDAAPLLPVSDALPLAATADYVVMVVRLHRTRRSELLSAIAKVQAAGSPGLLIVGVGVQSRGSSYYGKSSDSWLSRIASGRSRDAGRPNFPARRRLRRQPDAEASWQPGDEPAKGRARKRAVENGAAPGEPSRNGSRLAASPTTGSRKPEPTGPSARPMTSSDGAEDDGARHTSDRKSTGRPPRSR